VLCGATGCARTKGESEFTWSQRVLLVKSRLMVRSTRTPFSLCSSDSSEKIVASVIAGTVKQTVIGPLNVAVVVMSNVSPAKLKPVGGDCPVAVAVTVVVPAVVTFVNVIDTFAIVTVTSLPDGVITARLASLKKPPTIGNSALLLVLASCWPSVLMRSKLPPALVPPEPKT
jgi:hypothetical protein